MSITVLDPGLLTTVQDMGRVGYQQFGIPVSGAIDPRVRFQKDREMVTGGDLFMKKGGKIRKTP